MSSITSNMVNIVQQKQKILEKIIFSNLNLTESFLEFFFSFETISKKCQNNSGFEPLRSRGVRPLRNPLFLCVSFLRLFIALLYILKNVN